MFCESEFSFKIRIIGVTVVPVTSEQGLRTRAWVESNRRLVEKLSEGQLAYVYLPNTGQPGYSSFDRYYFPQQDEKGVREIANSDWDLDRE